MFELDDMLLNFLTPHRHQSVRHRSLPLEGPGVAAKVVVVARTRVSNAPLGEPFRVLTKEAAEKVCD